MIIVNYNDLHDQEMGILTKRYLFPPTTLQSNTNKQDITYIAKSLEKIRIKMKIKMKMKIK